MKNFKPSKELKQAAETLLLAKTYTETIRPTIEGYQTELLKKLQFKIADKWVNMERTGLNKEVITDHKRTYLMDDEDFNIYLKELHQKHIEHGFKDQVTKGGTTKEIGFCPLLIAEDTQRQARKLLIDAAEYITGISYDKVNRVKDLEKLEDLTLRLVVPFLDRKEILKTLETA